jgi:cyclopropane fatty-acyl-phospholipid synthase-like methyltransferase
MFFQLIIILAFVFISSIAIAGLSFAPWVPAWKKDLPRIFKLAALKPGEVFYDLGCGNGKVVLYANKNFQARAIGLEISLPMYLVCKARQIFNSDKNLVFKLKNLYKEDLSRADAVYFFGMPDKVAKLRAKLEKELKPGCRVISYVFPIAGWQEAVKDKPKPTDIAIYLYTIG